MSVMSDFETTERKIKLMTSLIKVNKIILLIQEYQADHITLWTNLPGAEYPFDEKLSLEFRAGQATGEDYINQHFPGVPVEIIDLRNKKVKIPYSGPVA